MATFDKKAYEEQIENLTIEEVQDRIVDIDDRTYEDLHRRELLVKRRSVLFKTIAPPNGTVELKRWAFGLKQMKKPHFPEISKKDIKVASFIIQKHPEFLKISREDLELVLVEMGFTKDQIKEFVNGVSMNTAPSITAKRL